MINKVPSKWQNALLPQFLLPKFHFSQKYSSFFFFLMSDNVNFWYTKKTWPYIKNGIFVLYLGSLSWNWRFRGQQEKRGGHLISLYHFHQLTNIDLWCLTHIFNRSACNYQTFTGTDLSTSESLFSDVINF